MARRLPVTLALLGLVGPSIADPKWPTGLKVRLVQREDFGVKIKCSYTLKSPASSFVEACINCDAIKPMVVEGSHCGGHPNGCSTFKLRTKDDQEWFWAQDTIAVRLRVDGGDWSAPVAFRVDKSIRGESGMVPLEQLEDIVHDEL